VIFIKILAEDFFFALFKNSEINLCPMKLYGSLTSPYVRRIRFLLLELGVSFDLIDTMTEEGQKELRTKNPLWKVPYFEVDDLKIWDSHTITDYLCEKNKFSQFRDYNAETRIQELNLVNAIDGALDAGINLFYLNKDGVSPNQSAYLKKQNDRIASVISYVKGELKQGYFFSDRQMGRAELSLYTTLDWFDFRKVYPVAEDLDLIDFMRLHCLKTNLEKTAPPR